MQRQSQKAETQFCFESFGVPVRVESSDPQLLRDAKAWIEDTFIDNFQVVESVDTRHVYRLERRDSIYLLKNKGRTTKYGESKTAFLRSFDSIVRVTVAEFAAAVVFVHAGVVGWKGKAIVIPGKSFSGKTTLVAELVRKGAEYYSDEYAVFDESGLVHPFARKLAIRDPLYKSGILEISYLTAANLGGKAGKSGIPAGLILMTEFQEGAEWDPRPLSPGQAMMEMLSQTIPIRYKPEFSLNVLKKVTTNAIILKSYRSDAIKFAEIFLEFVDNKAF